MQNEGNGVCVCVCVLGVVVETIATGLGTGAGAVTTDCTFSSKPSTRFSFERTSVLCVVVKARNECKFCVSL